MQHESTHAQQYSTLWAISQNDCNFMRPPAAFNSYMTLSLMSCSSGRPQCHIDATFCYSCKGSSDATAHRGSLMHQPCIRKAPGSPLSQHIPQLLIVRTFWVLSPFSLSPLVLIAACVLLVRVTMFCYILSPIFTVCILQVRATMICSVSSPCAHIFSLAH